MSDFSRLVIIIYTIFMILFMIGFAVYIGRKTGDTLRGKRKMPKKYMWIFILGTIGTWIVLIYIIVYIFFPNIVDFTLPIPIVQNIYIEIVGTLLIIIGTTITTIAMFQLGISARVYIPNAKTNLITSRVYRFCRNPGYLGVYLSWVGIFLLILSFLYLIALCLFIVGMHFRILQEEQFLKDTFGVEYENYMKEVGRYFPKIRRK